MSKSDVNKYTRNISTHRLPWTRSAITMIFLSSRSISLKKEIEIFTRLRVSYDHTILCYTKLSKAIKYVNRAISHEYLIIVINELDLRSSQYFIYRCEQNRQVRAILIKAPKDEDLGPIMAMMTHFNKVFVYQESDALFIQLQQLLHDATQEMDNDGLIIASDGKVKALRDVRHELGAFAWGYSNVCK